MNREQRSIYIKRTIIGLVVIVLIYWTIKHFTSKPPVMPLQSVVVEKPLAKTMTEYVTQTGTTVAYNSVNLVARIEGYLTAVEFTDGTFIKKGKELFVIEPLPYLEKLKAAQASVEVQKADYTYSKSEYERQKRMYKQNATSLNNVEKWAAKTIASKAEIDKAVADAEVTSINYSYTHVHAPFDGRIGRHLVDPGNLVGNGIATDLATIQQIDPIYVYFNLNELDLFKVREVAKANSMDPDNLSSIPVYVQMQNETTFKHEGRLNFVNTALNASTGTMEFRALLSNKELTLLPGLFVQVRVPIGPAKSQLTVPDTAIQYDQIGAYILIINDNNYVVEKRVTVGPLEQGRRAITKGLNAQDRVIVDGIQNATPGHQVSPVQSGNKQP